MQSTEPMTIGVPKNIYEILEDELEALSYKLAIDIAKTLDVDSKILIKEIKKEKKNIYIFEDGSDINISCKSYTLHKNIYIPCKHPIVYGENYCINHLLKSIIPPEGSPIVALLLYENTIYYRNVKNNVVYDSEGVLFGKWNVKKQIIIQITVDQ